MSALLSPVNSPPSAVSRLPKLVSVILPVRNQADHIERVVREHYSALSGLRTAFELLLVPNDCSDDSESICRRLELDLPGVKAVRGSSAGWGAAINAGIRAAEGDLICYASSARISAPDLFRHISFAIDTPGAVVKGRRLTQDNGLRSAGSSFYNWLCRVLFGFSTRDVNGTPKSFPRSLDGLLELSEPGYLVDVEFNVICKRNNYPVIELPIESTTRHGGKSTTSFRTAIGLFSGLFKYWSRVRQENPSSLSQTIHQTYSGELTLSELST